MTEANVLNFLEPESLLLWVDDCCLLLGKRQVRKGKGGKKKGETYEEVDFKRIEERDHHEREGLVVGVGIMDREGVCGVKVRYRQNE